MQRDAKLVSYDIIEKNTKPYVQVQIGSENKVRLLHLCREAQRTRMVQPLNEEQNV